MGSADGDRAALALDAELQRPVLADGRVVLRDLEVLGQVGVVVVLPVEVGLLGDVGVDGLADLHGGLDGSLVDHRERTRQAETHRTGVGVWLVVGDVGRTATEDLRVRLELDVDLQPDDGREFAGLGGFCSHYPPFGVRWLKANDPDRRPVRASSAVQDRE